MSQGEKMIWAAAYVLYLRDAERTSMYMLKGFEGVKERTQDVIMAASDIIDDMRRVKEEEDKDSGNSILDHKKRLLQMMNQ